MTLLLLLLGCPGSKLAPGDSPASDVDSDTDADTDAHADTDSDTDTDTDTDTDIDADKDSDSDTDTGTAPSDADGDGHLATTAGGDDCDDADPYTYPGAVERCGDGTDNNCDELVLECAWEDMSLADAPVEYDGDGHYFGGVVAGAGDVNQDGFDDVLVETSTGGYLFLGSATPTSGSYTMAGASWTDDSFPEAGRVSNCAGVGDVNGDGYGDVLIGHGGSDGTATGTGLANLIFGSPTPASGSLGDVALVFPDDGTGLPDWPTSVAAAGDVNDDGLADMLVGNPYAGIGGAAYLLLGSTSLTADALQAAADATYEGAYPDLLGWDVTGGGDINGDGYDDMALSELGTDTAYVVLGSSPPTSRTVSSRGGGDQDARMLDAGAAVAGGDVNNDGYADLFVEGMDGSGVALVLGASVPWSGPMVGADATYSGNCVLSAAAAGDVDADGYADMLLGGPTGGDCFPDDGAGWLIFGSAAPVSDSLSGAGVEFLGQPGDRVGISVAGAGDVNADGAPDLLFGGYFGSEVAPYAGVVYLVTGGM